MRWTTPLAVAFLATATLGAFGCATQPKPQPVAAASCLPMRSYSKAEQKALADQLSTMPPDSPLAQAVVELERMRDADRACLASRQ